MGLLVRYRGSQVSRVGKLSSTTNLLSTVERGE